MVAGKELRTALEEMDHSTIQECLFKANWLINWKPSPPAESHMGGVWEWEILSVRSILSALL